MSAYDIPPEFLKGLAMLCVAGAAACAGLVLATAFGAAARAKKSLRELVIVPDMDSPLMRAFLPMARPLGALAKTLAGGGRRASLYGHFAAAIGRRLSAAGRPQGINAEEYVGYGLLISVFFGLMGVFAWLWAGEGILAGPGACCLAGAGLGAWYWWSWLGRKKHIWQRSIQRDLPFCLDLLTLAMDAGMDFTAALGRIVGKIGLTPLGRELTFALREIQLGKRRGDALRDFARRVDVPEAGTVAASLIQAEEMGASLGPILRILAAQQRERRSQRAEETAMKAPVKILFPLVMCHFPCVLIVLAVPIALAISKSMG